MMWTGRLAAAASIAGASWPVTRMISSRPAASNRSVVEERIVFSCQGRSSLLDAPMRVEAPAARRMAVTMGVKIPEYRSFGETMEKPHMKTPLLFACLFLSVLFINAQSPPPQAPAASQSVATLQPPFWNEIAEFKRKDSLHHPRPTGFFL